jgi:hypothetical protein
MMRVIGVKVREDVDMWVDELFDPDELTRSKT